jgi:AcrR family transcriptional regulator
MARTQAADYAERRERIVGAAAQLFAERGFLGASIADLAGVCHTSKSLIYHCYASKEDILFDVMHSHVRDLLDAAEDIACQPLAPATKLKEMTLSFMQLYLGAADRQRVLLNELDQLPEDQRKIVIGIQHRLIEIVERVLAELRPELSGRNALRTPGAMLYFGMLNWTHTWLNPDGRAKPAKIASLAANIFLEGLMKAEIPV